ncbi:MAG: hypothetical protein A7316_05435 [Candidatus Altiarchaeales archaeon WOR_SM1_86-2]|nr:MAG: hypothetical protein A7316_05435 [Candidatus Altiarchaeales archaeon WOR_SM1_86-2]ODS39736.1 MAG: hypothetical protein A7315_10580 [Candidatus Altiarchaeales archaeon WOR_SM1_79]
MDEEEKSRKRTGGVISAFGIYVLIASPSGGTNHYDMVLLSALIGSALLFYGLRRLGIFTNIREKPLKSHLLFAIGVISLAIYISSHLFSIPLNLRIIIGIVCIILVTLGLYCITR